MHCSLSGEEVEHLPPAQGPPVYHVEAFQDAGPSLNARLGRLFGRERLIEEKD